MLPNYPLGSPTAGSGVTTAYSVTVCKSRISRDLWDPPPSVHDACIGQLGAWTVATVKP